MSVATLDLLHSFAYIKTVNNPVNKNAHHTQLPATPSFLTISVTKFGVSVEKVVATIEIPNNHQGIFLPERKYSEELEDDFFETKKPIIKVAEKKLAIIT
jgi:hypothetical protein